MESQAAVRNSSSRRSSSCGSGDASSNRELSCPHRIAENQHALHFTHARYDGTLHRASRRSFENDLDTLPSPADGTVDPEAPVENIRSTGGPIHQAPRISPIAERQLSDGVDAESAATMRDPFPDHATSHPPLTDSTGGFPFALTPSALTSHPARSPNGQQDSSPQAVASPSQQPPSSPYNTSSMEQRAPINMPMSSHTPLPLQLQPLTQPQPPSQPQTSDPLPAPLPSYEDPRATPPLHPSTPQLLMTCPTAPSPSTASHIQPNQPTRSTSNPSPPHQPPPVQRNRRRRRFVHWLRRRFRRQLPWPEGWLHGREGGERPEVRRAIRAAEEVGL